MARNRGREIGRGDEEERRRLRRAAVENLSHKREVNPFSHCFSTFGIPNGFLGPHGTDIGRWEGTLEVSGQPRHVWTANKWKLFLSDVLNPTAWQILFGRDIEVLKSRPISEVSRPEWIEAPVKGICSISSGGVVALSRGKKYRERK